MWAPDALAVGPRCFVDGSGTVVAVETVAWRHHHWRNFFAEEPGGAVPFHINEKRRTICTEELKFLKGMWKTPRKLKKGNNSADAHGG